MIDAVKLLAAHALASQSGPVVEAEDRTNEPAPRQFPLAGRGQLRPLADPTRTSESKE